MSENEPLQKLSLDDLRFMLFETTPGEGGVHGLSAELGGYQVGVGSDEICPHSACVNCTRCTYDTDCASCTRCTNCTGCTNCSGCTVCTACTAYTTGPAPGGVA